MVSALVDSAFFEQTFIEYLQKANAIIDTMGFKMYGMETVTLSLPLCIICLIVYSLITIKSESNEI